MADERDRDRDRHQSNSLVTEKDIDPEFGLFTEEARDGAVYDAAALLQKQHPGVECACA